MEVTFSSGTGSDVYRKMLRLSIIASNTWLLNAQTRPDHVAERVFVDVAFVVVITFVMSFGLHRSLIPIAYAFEQLTSPMHFTHARPRLIGSTSLAG